MRQLQETHKGLHVHFIRTDTLTREVTENLRQVTQYALKHESRFVRQVADKSEWERLREAAAMNVEKFLNVVMRHINFEELTPTLLHEFIDRIVVHEAEKFGIRRTQRIEIYYSFIGAVKLPEKAGKPDKSA